MRILITGGAGFIGSHLVDRMIQGGFDVRIFDNLESQVHRSGKPAYLNSNAEFVLGDVRNRDQLRHALSDIDIIFHLAAATGVGQSMYQITKYFEVNVQGTANLLDILANSNHNVRKIVLSSSRAIYGEGAYRCNHCGVVYPNPRSIEQLKHKQWDVLCPQCSSRLQPVVTSEKKPANPASIYGITKLTQEMMVANFSHSYDLPSVILRSFNVFGPRQSLNNPYTGIFTAFFNRLAAGKPPQVYENGLMTRDFVEVGDVVNACALSMEKEIASGTIINIGTGISTSILELATLFCGFFGSNLPPQIVEKARIGDIAACTADLEAARELLGFKPRVSLRDGLRGWIEYELANKHTQDDLSERAENELRAAGLLISQ